MKNILLSIAILILYSDTTFAQEIYSYYYASYAVEGGKREMMVCKTEPFTWVGDKVTGMSQIDYVPEANFRKWLDNNYGNKAKGRDFYPCTSADQAINYYKDFAVIYQQGYTPFKNSAYCSSIYSVAYIEPAKKSGTDTSMNNSTGNTNSSPTNDATTRYQNEMTKYNEEIAKAENKRKTDAAQAEQMGETISEFAGTVINNIMEQSARNSEIKNARFLRNIEIKRQNEEKAKLAFKYFLPEAEKGNEYAIEKVFEAYELIGDKTLGIEFATSVYNKYNSPIAQKKLTNYWVSISDNLKNESKRHGRKALSNFIWGGVFFGIAHYGGNYLFEQETKDTPVDEWDNTGSSIAQYGGGILGAYLTICSLLHVVQIGYKKDTEYIKSQKNLKIVDPGNKSISFGPSLDLRNRGFGVAVNLMF